MLRSSDDGPKAALEIQADAEDQGEEDERCEYLAEMIPDDPGIEKVESKGGAEEKNVGDEPGGNPIESIAGTVSGGCDRTLKDLPREPLEQDHLEHDEDEHDRNSALTRPGPVHANRAPAGGSEQRRKRTVEWLESADDPEDDRRGWSEEDQEAAVPASCEPIE